MRPWGVEAALESLNGAFEESLNHALDRLDETAQDLNEALWALHKAHEAVNKPLSGP